MTNANETPMQAFCPKTHVPGSVHGRCDGCVASYVHRRAGTKTCTCLCHGEDERMAVRMAAQLQAQAKAADASDRRLNERK